MRLFIRILVIGIIEVRAVEVAKKLLIEVK
jgi:hypothetical protein